MNEPIIYAVIEPKNRRERRLIDNEIERVVSDYNTIENLFLSVLFRENFTQSYKELYKIALEDWQRTTKRNYKLNRFRYCCPNIRYFEDKFKPLENAY